MLVDDPARSWTVFVAREYMKQVEVFEIHIWLWPGARILFKHKWNELAEISFLLHCIDGFGGLGYQKEFNICVLGFNWNFTHIALLRKSLQLDSETDLTINGLISEFFDAIWLFLLPSNLHRLKLAWVAQRCYFFDDVETFRWLIWSSSNVLVLFSHMFLWYRLMRFFKAIQFYFLWLLRLSAFFSCK